MWHKLNPVKIIPIIASVLLLAAILILLKSGVKPAALDSSGVQETDQKYAVDYKQIDKFVQEINVEGGKNTYLKLKENTRDLPFKEKHDLAHLLGKALYKSQGNQAVSVCDADMSFGCYHGLFIEAINTEGIGVIKTLDQACANAGKNLYTGCQHGIGHGLVEYFGHKVADIPKALEQCKIIQKNLLLGCSSGVFMEYFFPTSLSEDQKEYPEVNADNPFKICKSLDPAFVNSCIYELPRLWRKTEKDINKFTARCLGLNNATHQKSCFRGLGYATGNSLNPNPGFSLSICKKMPDEQKKLYCLSGATWFYSSIDRSGIVDNAINSLCKESNNEKECKNLSNLHFDKI